MDSKEGTFRKINALTIRQVEEIVGVLFPTQEEEESFYKQYDVQNTINQTDVEFREKWERKNGEQRQVIIEYHVALEPPESEPDRSMYNDDVAYLVNAARNRNLLILWAYAGVEF